MYSAFAESVGFAPQRIHDTQLEATNIKSSAYSWRNLSLRSHWNIFSFADVDTLKFKVIFPRRKVEACDMSLAGRDDYVFCCKHEQCGTRLKCDNRMNSESKEWHVYTAFHLKIVQWHRDKKSEKVLFFGSFLQDVKFPLVAFSTTYQQLFETCMSLLALVPWSSHQTLM